MLLHEYGSNRVSVCSIVASMKLYLSIFNETWVIGDGSVKCIKLLISLSQDMDEWVGLLIQRANL